MLVSLVCCVCRSRAGCLNKCQLQPKVFHIQTQKKELSARPRNVHGSYNH